jgi:hypothetical protein
MYLSSLAARHERAGSALVCLERKAFFFEKKKQKTFVH